MLSLLGQLCRLREGSNVLCHFLTFTFSSSLTSPKSCFWKVRNLCLQYGLPHPIEWLKTQPSKEEVKRRCRPLVIEYWLKALRSQAAKLVSLRYLDTRFLGLTRCHPIFRLCPSSSWEVEKATVQVRLVSEDIP